MSEGGSSLVFGVAGGWNKGGRTHRLPAMPLDHYLRDAPDIVLKIDVEGHEWPMLQGTMAAIESGRVRAILIDGFGGQAEQNIVGLLRGNGFELLQADDLTPYVHGTMAIFAVRSGAASDAHS